MDTTGNINDLFPGFINGTLKAGELSRLFLFFGETDEATLRGLIRAELESDVAVQSKSDELDKKLEVVYNNISERIGFPAEATAKVRAIRWSVMLRVAASIALAVGVSWLLIHFFNPFASEPEWNRISTRLERKKIVLPEGTNIWLAPQTTLEYPERFREDQREVRLNGEAFFDVTKDPDRPFQIHSGELTTRVLGTSFNINAYAGEPAAKVTVLTGKVSVAAGPAKQVQLTPYEQAIFETQSGKLSEHNFPNAGDMLRRRNGDFMYEGASLAEVIRDIQHTSAYDITADVSLSECVFYGEMKAGEDPLAFLESVCRVNNLTMHRKNGTEITITGKGCRR